MFESLLYRISHKIFKFLSNHFVLFKSKTLLTRIKMGLAEMFPTHMVSFDLLNKNRCFDHQRLFLMDIQSNLSMFITTEMKLIQ